jgi:hypothetical protein
MIGKILYSSECGGKGNVPALLKCIDAKPDCQGGNAERAEGNHELHLMTCLSGYLRWLNLAPARYRHPPRQDRLAYEGCASRFPVRSESVTQTDVDRREVLRLRTERCPGGIMLFAAVQRARYRSAKAFRICWARLTSSL